MFFNGFGVSGGLGGDSKNSLRTLKHSLRTLFLGVLKVFLSLGGLKNWKNCRFSHGLSGLGGGFKNT